MGNGETKSGTVEAWRPGSLCVVHVALGFSVLASLAMAVVSLGL